MTERLYYHDAELLAFDAVATGHDGDPTRVVLDRTAFYPTSGGQPHDTGWLGAARVVDVIDADDRIVHVLDAPLALGPVHGVVDATRRHDHMQQHSAQHLLSALAADHFGADTASVHFGPEHSAIEFATSPSDRELADLEARANAVVTSARPVTISFEAADQAIATGLRKPPARAGVIRVVTIADLDRSACGGTHVRSTAEIGPIVLRGAERIRGNLRVGFLAGDRVTALLRQRERQLTTIAGTLSCALDEAAELVPKRLLELQESRDRLAELEKEVAGARVAALFEATAPGSDGIRRAMVHGNGQSTPLLRAMIQAAATFPRFLLVLTDETPPVIHVAASADSGIDAGAVLKAALGEVGGRGGGSPRAAQGSVSQAAHLVVVRERVVSTPAG